MTPFLSKLVFLAGVPATGKSHFGEWCSREYGALHLDRELPEVSRRTELRAAWEALARRDARPLADALVRLTQLAILNWGYPADDSRLPEALRDAGFELWWFHASPSAARAAFAQRRTGELGNFDSQMGAIIRNEERIRQIFGPRTVCTLRDDGTRLDPQKIAEQIASINAKAT
jgi:hypothetical protein